MLHIRQAQVRDAAAMASGEREAARTPGLLNAMPGEIPEVAFRDKVATLGAGDRGLYAVAEMNAQLIGHVLLDPLSLVSRAHVVTLNIVVYPQWQSKGIGSTLLEHAIAWARKNPRIEKIELTVRADNTRAIALYHAAGFENEGLLRKRVKGADGVVRDDIAMAHFLC